MRFCCSIFWYKSVNIATSNSVMFEYTLICLLGLFFVDGYSILFSPTHNIAILGVFSGSQTLSVLKIIITLLGLLICVCFRSYDNRLATRCTEFYFLIYVLIISSHLLISLNNIFCIYLVLELQSLSLYVLVTLNRYSASSAEAAIKYFLQSAFITISGLYGISCIYCYYGTLCLTELRLLLPTVYEDIPFFAIVAVLLLLFTFYFKLGVVPFHYWLADTYQGTSLIITAIFAFVTKIPIILVILKMHLCFSMFPFQSFLFVIGFISILLGSYFALYEVRLKRFLAFSTIANMGYPLLILSFDTINNAPFALNYVVIYVLNTLIFITCLFYFSTVNKRVYDNFVFNDLQDLSLLCKSDKLLGSIFVVTVLSFIGMPPFAGFFAKFAILYSVLSAGNYLTALLIFLVSVFSSVYYIRILRFILFDGTDKYKYGFNCSNKYLGIVYFLLVFANIVFIFIQPMLIIQFTHFTL